MGVLTMRALPFGACIGAPDSWKLPYKDSKDWPCLAPIENAISTFDTDLLGRILTVADVTV